jgi:hypothetical protein
MCAADACVCRAQGLLQAFEQTCGKAPEELLSNPFQAQLLGQSSNSVQRRMNKLTERWVPGGGGGGGLGYRAAGAQQPQRTRGPLLSFLFFFNSLTQSWVPGSVYRRWPQAPSTGTFIGP